MFKCKNNKTILNNKTLIILFTIFVECYKKLKIKV